MDQTSLAASSVPRSRRPAVSLHCPPGLSLYCLFQASPGEGGCSSCELGTPPQLTPGLQTPCGWCPTGVPHACAPKCEWGKPKTLTTMCEHHGTTQVTDGIWGLEVQLCWAGLFVELWGSWLWVLQTSFLWLCLFFSFWVSVIELNTSHLSGRHLCNRAKSPAPKISFLNGEIPSKTTTVCEETGLFL